MAGIILLFSATDDISSSLYMNNNFKKQFYKIKYKKQNV